LYLSYVLNAPTEIDQRGDSPMMVLLQPGEKQKTHPKVRLFLE
jgi:hypothetical protein